ncbi:MAG: FkbM family methyltransferase [Candidatus Loosdrechtia sp.]|uniref:FkbM family methyltransferase n=1 Tax=Candidatus Loosdrechtia sp. TaxID=3101272 RepID=UPI003A68B8B5|nr:MAG: FkbM family methyltransferase [Candidatus Jettenia sp. AMX2]
MNRASKNTLLKIATEVGLTALDVGSRGGVSNDLRPLSRAVDYYGFEPEPTECERLKREINHSPWKSVTYLATALADKDRELKLNLYRQRGCSSVFNAQRDVGKRFSRGGDYIHDGEVSISAKCLDNVVKEHKIPSPAHMKIDVQGMEVDVFNGAHEALTNSLVGIRTEVEFFPLYEGQPLFAEVDQTLRPYGFVPMRWLELHEWRRNTRVKYPFCSSGELPCSRGQIIHGDVLYLLQPEVIEGNTEVDARRLIRLGLIAICYEHLDHAQAAFSHPIVARYLGDKVNADLWAVLKQISRRLKRKAWFVAQGVRISKILNKSADD